MMQSNLPIINLDLDLLRTFTAVADCNTFTGAANTVRKTQSTVSQQMQRLEKLVNKKLFTRHGRKKFLTEHGLNLLKYARKILRFNDEACISIMRINIKENIKIGASYDAFDLLSPFLLNRIVNLYPYLTIENKINKSTLILDMLYNKKIDLAFITSNEKNHPQFVLRTSPVFWFCSANYQFHIDQPIPLIIMEEPSQFCKMAITCLENAEILWKRAYVASSYADVKAAVSMGLGIIVRPMAMMNFTLRILGKCEKLPTLPEVNYSLCKNKECSNEIASTIFNNLKNIFHPTF